MDVIFDRRPIVDQRGQGQGLELLCRPVEAPSGRAEDADQQAAAVLVGAFADMPILEATGGLPAFVRLTPNLLRNQLARPLPHQHSVLLVDEQDGVFPDVVVELEELAAMGHVICVDRFTGAGAALSEICSFVRVHVGGFTDDELRSLVSAADLKSVTIIASGIDNTDLFERCVEMGFDLFQGHAVATAPEVRVRGLEPSRRSLLEVLSKFAEPGLEVAQVERILSSDLGLAYRLLRLVDEGYGHHQRPADSMAVVIQILGAETSLQWVRLFAVAGLGHTARGGELTTTAALRAKMCELLGRATGAQDLSAYYLTGLLSALPTVLDLPMEHALRGVAVSEGVRRALVDGEGPLSSALSLVMAHERSEWRGCDTITDDEVERAYLEAVAWAGYATTGASA